MEFKLKENTRDFATTCTRTYTYFVRTYMYLARALFDGIFRRELTLSSRTAGLTLHFAQRGLYATYVCRHGYFIQLCARRSRKRLLVCLATLEYIFERARARPLSKLTRSFSPPRSNFVRIMRVWGPSRGTLLLCPSIASRGFIPSWIHHPLAPRTFF